MFAIGEAPLEYLRVPTHTDSSGVGHNFDSAFDSCPAGRAKRRMQRTVPSHGQDIARCCLRIMYVAAALAEGSSGLVRP